MSRRQMLTGSEGPMLARPTEVLLNKQEKYVLQQRRRPIIPLTDTAAVHGRNYNTGKQNSNQSLTVKPLTIYDNNNNKKAELSQR